MQQLQILRALAPPLCPLLLFHPLSVSLFQSRFPKPELEQSKCISASVVSASPRNGGEAEGKGGRHRGVCCSASHSFQQTWPVVSSCGGFPEGPLGAWTSKCGRRRGEESVCLGLSPIGPRWLHRASGPHTSMWHYLFLLHGKTRSPDSRGSIRSMNQGTWVAREQASNPSISVCSLSPMEGPGEQVPWCQGGPGAGGERPVTEA